MLPFMYLIIADGVLLCFILLATPPVSSGEVAGLLL